MATATLGAVRRVLDRVRLETKSDSGDGELLRRWHRHRDESAFAGLVQRHGGLVLGVCRRVLRDPHAAEDAFQATFMVLAKKAECVRPPGVLGPWLHGVAVRTALKARGRAVRRQQVERDYAIETNRGAAAHGGSETCDLAPLLDEQMNALPEKYRRPLVLCGVQGLGKAEAAARLGWPEGTVSSRLARARELLRDRLARRGVIVPATTIAALLVPENLHAAAASPLLVATADAAVGLVPASPAVLTLSQEVLHAMTLAKFKMLSAVAVAFALSGSGFGLYSAAADDKKPQPAPESVKKPQPEAVKKPDAPKPETPKPDQPKPEKKPDGPRLSKGSGKIVNVIPADRTVAVLRKTDGGGVNEIYIPVADDARITVDGKPADLKAVPKDAVAAYVLRPGAKDGEPTKIIELHVTGGNVGGVIVKVDATSITVDPSGKEAKLPPQTISVGADTKIQGVKDGGAKLADLKPGDKVTVVLGTDGKSAIQINAAVVKPEGGGDRKPEKPSAKPEGEKPGVKKLDGEKPGVKKPDGEKPPVKPEKPSDDE